MAILTIINMYGELDTIDLDTFASHMICAGRNDQENQIILLDPVVSSRQMTFYRANDGHYGFFDNGSANGTILTRLGQRYIFNSPEQRAVLEDGDVLRIGDPDSPNRQTLILYCERGTAKDWTQYAIGSSPVTLGHHPNCLIPVPIIGSPEYIGSISANGLDSCVIELAGPMDGVLLNGSPFGTRAVLTEKDVLSLFSRPVIYSKGSLFYRKKTDGISLEASHISKLVPAGSKSVFSGKKKKILDDVSLVIEPNQFVAIIGGSGAGKTTLMNALSAFDPNFTGSVRLNGTDLVSNFEQFKSEIGYVPQQDILYEEFPLDKMLESAARLRMPQSSTRDQIKKRVKQVLAMVDLSQHEKTIISKLSGGQKKRASSAVELLSDPQLFFLDEPTSGLDPGTEKALMLTLNRLAKEYNKTIIMVTHNISSLEKCDQVIFMEPGGRLAFMGPVAKAKSYFHTSELSDVYQILSEDRNGQYAAAWRASQSNQAPTVPNTRAIKPRSKDSFFHQWGVLLNRYFSLLFRKKSLLALLIIQPIIIAVLLALVASEDTFTVYDDTKSMMFSLACAAIWLGLFDTIQDICSERTIIKREYMNKLRLSCYLGAKLVVYSCVGIIQALLLGGIYLAMMGQNLEGIFMPWGDAEMILVLFMTILASQALGFIVSALSRSADKAMVSAPFLLIIQLLFSGILFKLEGFGEFISYFTISKWSVEGLGSVANLNALESRIAREYPDLPLGEREVEEVFRYSVGHLNLVLFILLLFVVVEMILCALALRRIKKDQR